LSSGITVELQIALSTHIFLFATVALRDYVELLRKIKL